MTDVGLLGYLAAITLRAAAPERDMDLTRMLVVSFVFKYEIIRATAHASVFVRAIEEHTLRAQYEHSNDTWPENIWKTGNIYHLQHCLMSTLFQIWSEQTQRFLGERSTFVRECKSLSSKRFLREHNIFERESKGYWGNAIILQENTKVAMKKHWKTIYNIGAP